MSAATLAANPARLPSVIGLALLGGLATAVVGPPVLALALGGSLILIIARWPILGAGLWLLLCPLIVGIARGEGVMVLRPNEALLLVLTCGLGLHALWRVWLDEPWLPRLGPIDRAVACLALAGSLVPVVIRYGRGLELSPDDLLYALVFVKYLVLYALFRLAVREPWQVAACLKLALASAVVGVIVGMLQVKELAGVPTLLDRYYDAPFTAPVGPITERGTSTVASPFGVADMMCLCLAITLAWMFQSRKIHPLLLAAAGAFLGGCLAAGSFSGFIGIAVIMVAVGFACRRLLSLTTAMLPVAVVGVVLFWPTIANRLSGFDSRMGLPRSWLGRIENLERFVWPELLSGLNWLWGVRPAARIPAPEAWRDWVYIESGHAWLLWAGGVPLLVAFLALSWIVGRECLATAREQTGPVAIAAVAGFSGMAMIFTLMLLDPHLTVRGCADLFFPLLALAAMGQDRRNGPDAMPRAGLPACPDHRS